MFRRYTQEMVDQCIDVLHQVSTNLGIPYIPRDMILDIANGYASKYIPKKELGVEAKKVEQPKKPWFAPFVPPPPNSNVVDMFKWKRKKRKKK